MQHSKEWLSYAEQLTRLQQRGLHVSDTGKALEYLERIGYYRLSGYWYPFRERTESCCPWPPNKNKKQWQNKTDKLTLDSFKIGTSFEEAIQLYVFDKQLRLVVLDALERIEIALRVDIAHTLGKHDACAYLKPELFKDDFAKTIDPKTGLTKHHRWLADHAKLINQSRETFIKHNKQRYGLPIPIWVACEVWNFGTLSTLYAGMLPIEQNKIANKYGLTKGDTLNSWLNSLRYLRNICSHHSRLWNRNIDQTPAKPEAQDNIIFSELWQDPHTRTRAFLLFCICQHLMASINPNSTWWQRLSDHIVNMPELAKVGIDIKSLGIMEGWEEWF